MTPDVSTGRGIPYQDQAFYPALRDSLADRVQLFSDFYILFYLFMSLCKIIGPRGTEVTGCFLALCYLLACVLLKI